MNEASAAEVNLDDLSESAMPACSGFDREGDTKLNSEAGFNCLGDEDDLCDLRPQLGGKPSCWEWDKIKRVSDCEATMYGEAEPCAAVVTFRQGADK